MEFYLRKRLPVTQQRNIIWAIKKLINMSFFKINMEEIELESELENEFVKLGWEII